MLQLNLYLCILHIKLIKEGKMKFYYAPMSCAFATHVVLEDAEANMRR